MISHPQPRPLPRGPRPWPPEHWRLAFQGNLHEIPESDYRRIEGLMGQAVRS